ncbi:MAG TPA: FAD-dependent oxidoreductase [Mycobacteriales bacterium]
MTSLRDADVVVVGAGPGGLAAAAYLAVCGKRVVLVDARDVPGGHQSSFRRAGYEFEIGLHYVTPGPLRRLLEPLGISVEFTEFDPDALFTLQFPDMTVRLPRGFAAARDRLAAAFPSERRVVDAFLTTVETLDREMRQVQDRRRLRELARSPWQVRHLARHCASTVGGYLDSLGASPRLRSVLSWNDGIFAVAPSRLSLLGYASLTAGYLRGGVSYPRGGSTRISAALAGVVREHGGEVLLRTVVTRIVVAGGRVQGVDVRVGGSGGPTERILAPAVVAAGDLKRTFLELLTPDAVPARVRRRVRRLEMALPLAVMYLVLDRNLCAEGFPTTNPLVFPDDDGEAAYAVTRAGRMPAGSVEHVWLGSVADPGNPALCPPGQTLLELITVAPASREYWGVLPGPGHGELYRERKRRVHDQLLERADRAVPGIASSVVFADTATPVTDEERMLDTGGTSYGVAITPRQAMMRPGPVAPVPGLFLAGASTRTMHGLVGGLTGGVAAAAAVLGEPAGRLLGPLTHQLAPADLTRAHAAPAPVG